MIEFRRKWGRPWLVVLAVLAVACMSGVAGCGGGDDDDDDEYDFNGTWPVVATIVQSNVPQLPVGDTYSDVLRITQSGTNITVAIEGIVPLTGTCDPAAGTFTASGVDGPVTIQMNGVKVDDDTMSGEMTWSGGPGLVKFTWTANLVNRSLTISSGTSRGGLASALRSLR
jgi:hypothetical protein